MSDHMQMLGRFSVPYDAIQDQPDVIMQVMEGVIVVRAEFMFQSREIAYVALHPSFDVVPDGEEAPEYDCEIKEDGTVEWQRKQ